MRWGFAQYGQGSISFCFHLPRAPIIIGGMGLLYDLLSEYM